MRLWLVLVGVLLAIGGAAAAQDRAWVQIESQPTLREAEDRARAYATIFPDVVGFRVASGWYALALGPYTRAAAQDRLDRLRADNMIPPDSFIALGEVYRTPFWPVGADPRSLLPRTEAPATAEALAPLPLEPQPEPVPPPLVDETVAEARDSEAALDRPAREQLQDALKFFGYYTSSIDGAFGPGTRAAMEAWQEAKGFEPTGVLTTRQRADLLGERARIEAALGLQTITEEEAGIEIALPMALVAFDSYEPPFVHFAEKDGSGVRALLISQPGDEAALAGLYDVLQTLDVVPVTGPRERRDRSFVIEGADGRIAAYAQAEIDGGFIKGFMLVWETRQTELAGRALAAMKTSFKPVGQRALDPGLVALDDGARAGMLSGLEVRRPALSRSGFYVSATGQVLTVPEALDGCTRITLDGGPEADVTFADTTLGIALLTPRAPLSPPAVAGIETGPARPGTEVAVAGFPFEDEIPAPTLTYGVLAAEAGLEGETGLRRLDVQTRAGDAGGPVIDGAGAVLGLLLPRETGGSRVLPDGVAFAAKGAALAERLAAAGVTVTPPVRDGALAPEDLAARASKMTVLVSCWK
jgi:hypothetical protein